MFDDAAIAQLDFVADDGEGADSRARIPMRAEDETCARGSISLIAPSRRPLPRGWLGREVNHLAHQGGFGGEFAVHGGAALRACRSRRARQARSFRSRS